ncbi:hypothetical protein ZIOFF_039574 [Zingiber officinale]|uniref:RING-type domain-containing protein n=1 Tax=Zingiber officinale TaxID=94328 RepID=A0A8J5L0A0_ZINOF|nr:hypothetical protein ZIOFF_039574 [Zingiber officinale]
MQSKRKGRAGKCLISAVSVAECEAGEDTRVPLEDCEVNCAVCLCEIKEGDLVQVLRGCGHEFHDQCIAPWLQRHESCPLCRALPLRNDLQHHISFNRYNFNCDDSSRSCLVYGAIGYIIRDCKGKSIQFGGKFIRNSSTWQLEALAALEAIRQAANLRCSDLILESNSLSLIKTLRQDQMPDWSSLHTVHEIFDLCSKFQSIDFRFSVRGRRVAEAAAVARYVEEEKLSDCEWSS